MDKFINFKELKKVFIPSIMHTGTIFTRHLIAYSCYRFFIAYLWKMEDGIEIRNNVATGRTYMVHTSSELIYAFNNGYYEMMGGQNIPGENLGIFCAHFGEPQRNFISHLFVREMIGAFNTVMPLRDPLMAILSRHKRNVQKEKINCVDIINGFLLLSELYKDESIKFKLLPVDLYSNYPLEQRINVIKDIFMFLNIYKEGYSDSYIYEKAMWSIENSSNEVIAQDVNKEEIATIKKCIKEHDINHIKKIIPFDYKYLKDREHKIRPFLEEIGYKNLLWWG